MESVDEHEDDVPEDSRSGTEGETDSDGESRNPVRALGDGMGRVVRSERTAGVVASLEDRLARFRRERKIGKGTLRSTFVIGYRGFVADGRAHMRVRVMEEPVVPAPAEALTDPAVLRMNLRRFVALAFPGVKVRVRLGEGRDSMETDRHGYAAGYVPAPDLAPGWHDYDVLTEPDDPDEEPSAARGQVLVPDPTADVWVVSDIDDTVLQTGLAEGLVAVKNTLFGQARTRRAVPGMATLYRAIEAGRHGTGRAAFFYVSTGPWALYDMLSEFLRVRGFPAGPMFLTDWGPQERYITRSGSKHKRETLTRLFTAYPDARFVLVGDSGQQDAYNYTDLAVAHPGSVASVVILDVGLADQAVAVAEQGEIARAQGVDFHFVSDAREAADVLATKGIIEADAVAAVRAAYERS